MHHRNVARLETIVDEYGWPGEDEVGEDGAEAAWLVVHHAICDPALQRQMLPLLVQAADEGRIPAWQPAVLLDCIRYHEGRPQVYGSAFDWDRSGRMSPWRIENRAEVDVRRAAVGLPPLRESTRRVRAATAADRVSAPIDLAERRAEKEQFDRSSAGAPNARLPQSRNVTSWSTGARGGGSQSRAAVPRWSSPSTRSPSAIRTARRPASVRSTPGVRQ